MSSVMSPSVACLSVLSVDKVTKNSQLLSDLFVGILLLSLVPIIFGWLPGKSTSASVKFLGFLSFVWKWFFVLY